MENGPIAGFSTGLFVIGFNRGLGASNFSAISHGGVTFDSVVTLSSAGVLGGNILNLSGVTDTISGNIFTINVPLASVPSIGGAAPSSYLVNLWPRDISQAGNAAIADFAPDNSDLSVPEPLTVALFAAGLLSLTFYVAARPKWPEPLGVQTNEPEAFARPGLMISSLQRTHATKRGSITK